MSFVLQPFVFICVFIAMMCIMLAKTRHQKLINHYLSKHYPATKINWQRYEKILINVGNLLLLITFLVSFFSQNIGYAVVEWFGVLTLSAGIIVLGLYWLDKKTSPNRNTKTKKPS